MLSRVLRVGGKPLWFANPDIIPQLIGLTIGNMPVWVPMNQGIQANPFDGYLLGYPVIFTEHAQTLGVTGDLVCANLAGYYAAVKAGGVEFASSIHLYFDQNLTAFRWTFRINGQPILSKAVQPAKGATTKSHFVALASRP
jgi:HK97 family phage major capsid protein